MPTRHAADILVMNSENPLQLAEGRLHSPKITRDCIPACTRQEGAGLEAMGRRSPLERVRKMTKKSISEFVLHRFRLVVGHSTHRDSPVTENSPQLEEDTLGLMLAEDNKGLHSDTTGQEGTGPGAMSRRSALEREYVEERDEEKYT
jgi:hypothetical protein